jgi:hypothetical protein
MNLLQRIQDALMCCEISLALAVEIENDLSHAWAIGSDGDRFGLLVWVRPLSLWALVNADLRAARAIHQYRLSRHRAGLPDDELPVLRRWLNDDAVASDWNNDVQIRRLIGRSGGMKSFPKVEWERLVAAGPPTLAEIVAVAERP